MLAAVLIRSLRAHRTALIGAMLGLLSAGSSAQVDPADCSAIRAAYAAALTRAQVCDITAANDCGAQRPRAVEDACQCSVAVNPARTAELDRLLALYKSQSCLPAPRLCNRACVAPAHSWLLTLIVTGEEYVRFSEHGELPGAMQ